MPYPLNNVATVDAYPATPAPPTACSVTFPNARPQAFVAIAANGSVFARITYRQLANGVMLANPTTLPEILLGPGKGVLGAPIDIPPGAVFDRIDFRSGAVGVPGRVTVN